MIQRLGGKYSAQEDMGVYDGFLRWGVVFLAVFDGWRLIFLVPAGSCRAPLAGTSERKYDNGVLDEGEDDVCDSVVCPHYPVV